MQGKKYEQAFQALKWEALYVARSKGKEPDFPAFMEEIETLDPDLAALLGGSDVKGKTLLDIGAGVGWQAIRMSELGFQVTAVDVSAFALSQGALNAGKCGAQVEFLQDNILKTAIARKFDILVDRGCFTAMIPFYFEDYVASVAALIRPDGHFLLKLPRSRHQYGKLEALSGKFKVVGSLAGSYSGPKGEIWETDLFHLRPVSESRPEVAGL